MLEIYILDLKGEYLYAFIHTVFSFLQVEKWCQILQSA